MQLALHATATSLLVAAALAPALELLRFVAGAVVLLDFVRLAWTIRSGFARFAAVRDRWAAEDAESARGLGPTPAGP